MVIGSSPETVWVKINTTNVPEAIAAVTTVWKEFSPAQPIRYTFLDQSYARMYDDVRRMGWIFSCFAVLAIVVACLGTTPTELRHPLASQSTVVQRHRWVPQGQAPARRTRGRTRTDPSRMGEAARSSRDRSRSQARSPIPDGRHLASDRDRVPGRDPAPKPPLSRPARAERRSRLPSQFPRQPPQALQQSLQSTRTSQFQSSQAQPQHWI